MRTNQSTSCHLHYVDGQLRAGQFRITGEIPYAILDGRLSIDW